MIAPSPFSNVILLNVPNGIMGIQSSNLETQYIINDFEKYPAGEIVVKFNHMEKEAQVDYFAER